MAAVNKIAWVRNLGGAMQPLVMLGKFAAGASQVVKRGELIALAANVWAPLGADQAMDGTIAIANEEIKSGDLAGYYEIIIPRPDDVFEFALAAGSAIAVGTELFYSNSQTLTVTPGTNVIGRSQGQTNYPKQYHLSADASGDAGVTIRSTTSVEMTFDGRVSYFGVVSRNGHLPAVIADLTAATGVASSTISDVGGAFNQTTLNNNFKSLAAQLNSVTAALRASGVIAAS